MPPRDNPHLTPAALIAAVVISLLALLTYGLEPAPITDRDPIPTTDHGTDQGATEGAR